MHLACNSTTAAMQRSGGGYRFTHAEVAPLLQIFQKKKKSIFIYLFIFIF
jgi:hypothetical protein